MAIFHITGPSKSGKTFIANALRNSQVGQAKGALMVDEGNDGGAKELLEKIIVGVPLVPGVSAKEIPWKPESIIIFVNDSISRLEEFKALVPDIEQHFGPVIKVQLA